MHFAPFFFFFFFEFRPDSADTGRYGPSRPFRLIQADMDRVGPIWAASAPISAASARFGNRHVARRGTDARSAASLSRPAASDTGALAWEPRPCIPGFNDVGPSVLIHV